MTSSFEIVNNVDFYREQNFLDFLKKYGKFFRVTSMMRRDSVQKRLESDSGLSLLEFMYSVLQAYDFWYLFQTKGCVLQVGGSDQLGNIQSGTDFIQKLVNSGQGDKETKDLLKSVGCHGVTTNLLVNEQGQKFGKSENEVIWVDSSDVHSLLNLHQFLVNQSDSLVERLLKDFTFLSVSEIEDIVKVHETEPEKKLAQFRLSSLVLEQLTNDASLTSQIMNYREYFDMDVSRLFSLDSEEIEKYFANLLNVFEMDIESLSRQNIIEVLWECSNQVFTKKEIKKILSAKGVRVNGKIINNKFTFDQKDGIDKKFFVVKLTKKIYFTIKLKM